MFWRKRKVLRDRAAGMVFDWRRGHGSTQRLFLGLLVSGLFWGGLLAYVQIREPHEAVLEDDQIDVTLVDLDEEGNRWLADLIDRETVFQQRWEVGNSGQVEDEVERLLVDLTPRVYEPTLREISMPEVKVGLSDLPGWEAGVLPEPDQVEAVSFATPPVNWWMDVQVIEGPKGLGDFAFEFPWSGDASLMSEGESWIVVATVDWRGTVVSIDGGWEKAEDPRTREILDQIRSHEFGRLPTDGGLRIWRMEATLVNRPVLE